MRITVASLVAPLVASLTLATSTASADGTSTPPLPAGEPYPAAYPTPQLPASATTARSGLTFGIGVSLGSLQADCNECGQTFEAGGINAHVGVMVAPYLALIGEAWTMAHTNGFLTVYQNLATVSARAWLTKSLWIQGGIGAATAGYRWHGFFVDREDRTESSPGVTAAVGYELPLKRDVALDLQLRAGTGFYDKDPIDGYVVKGHSVGVGASLAFY